MSRVLRHSARGFLGLGICAGFGWLMAEAMTSLNNHLDHIN